MTDTGGQPYFSVPSYVRLEMAWAKEHLQGPALDAALARAHEHRRRCPTVCTCR